MRKAVITILILLLMACGWLAWIAFQPPRERPDISIMFSSYIKSASGEQLAMFTVTNLSHSDIHIGGGWTLLKLAADSNSWVRVREPFWLNTLLAQRAGTNILIPPPTNQMTWKYAIDVHNDIGLEQEIRYMLTRKGRPRPYVFNSPWVEFAK